MARFRDLKPEISKERAVAAVTLTVADFIDSEAMGSKVSHDRLAAQIDRTKTYVRPLMDALALEGSYHLGTPCHLCEPNDEDCLSDCTKGSPRTERIQQDLAPKLNTTEYGIVEDEFHQSWWINPLSDPPFFHPQVHLDEERRLLNLGTVTEAVYEKADTLVDGGFFSNTALELRAKFNSAEAITNTIGEQPKTSGEGVCSQMNALTIQWAISQLPEVVRRRYLERGVKFRAGRDIEFKNGPSWIWTHLDFNIRKVVDGEE